MDDKILLCSDCFKNEGLRLDSFKIGLISDQNCPNCRSKEGKKLNLELTKRLAYRFFVIGTLHKSTYGASPIIQFNHHQKTSITIFDALKEDIQLFEKAINVGFFYYSPRLWMIGEISPLKSLQSATQKGEIINRIISEFPTKYFLESETFYRLRKNPEKPENNDEYDSPPILGNGRFDSSFLPVLYGSQDIEVCVHECRSTVEDNLFIASLCPTSSLKLLDLTELLKENVTEFESLDISIHMLFYAGSHSYEITREIAISAQAAGFHGIIYPSYFTTLRSGEMPFDSIHGISIRKIPFYSDYVKSQVISNIALFGKPIAEGKVTVKCINKLILNKVQYEIQFGPVNY